MKLLRDRGWEQEANEAYIKLREVSTFKAMSSTRSALLAYLKVKWR